MDRWERRLQIVARSGSSASNAAPRLAHHEGDGDGGDAHDVLEGVDRDISGRIHPDEIPTIRLLLDVAAARPTFRAELPLLLREGERWVNRDMEVCTELMGPVLRPVGGVPPRRRRTDAVPVAPLDRPALLKELAAALDRCGESGLAVLLLDIDRFKMHNDSLGDQKGDEVLSTLERRIADTAGRSFSASIGSDEFVVIIEGTRDLERAQGTAERIRRAIAEPIDLDGDHVSLTATVGVALGGPGSSAEQLLRDADTAVFTGKDNGRDRAELFDEHLETRTARRVASTQALRRALEDGTLELHYQPVVSLDTELVVGAEALLRMTQGDDGHRTVRPARLVDVAEDVGLIDQLGRFVLGRTVAHLAAWETHLGPHRRFRVSVNVSPAQLAAPGFTESVAAALADSGVDPSRLALELNESIFLDPDPGVDAAVEELIGLGVSFGLDDFGADRSSFGGLRRFSADFVKLDRHVVADLDRDQTDEIIASSAIALVHQLGFTTVAVGVEREAQKDILRRLGCDAAQGYLFAPPVPAEELLARL